MNTVSFCENDIEIAFWPFVHTTLVFSFPENAYSFYGFQSGEFCTVWTGQT